jgi:hypothetical protein
LVIESKEHNHRQKNIISKNNCDGLNCFNSSTNKIEVSAGKYGRINLSLCDSCACLFKEKKNEVQNITNAV